MWRPERLRAGLNATLCGLAIACGGLGPAALAQTPASVPLAQADEMQIGAAAVQALTQGQRPVAAALAAELLRRDARDPLGHLIFAKAAFAAGDTATARAAARRSFGTAQSPRQHYEAARLAGQVALSEHRFGAAAWWARQTIQFAPDDRARRVGVQDYRRLGAINPLAFSFKLGIRPSNNVNGGAEERTNVIDGFDAVGWLSDDAMALRGVAGTADATVSWRLAQDPKSETRIAMNGYARVVDFAGRPTTVPAHVPGTTPPPAVEIRNADYSSASLDVALSQSRRFGPGLTGTGQIEAGRSWQGGAAGYDWVGVSMSGVKALGPALALSFGAAAEDRDWVDSPRSDRRHALDLGLRGAVAQGTWGLGLSASALDSNQSQARNWTLSGSASFAPKAQLGPLTVSLAAGLSTTVYPDFTVIGFHPAGGRQDDAAFAELGLVAPKLGIAAFAPEVKLQAVTVESNVSRFSRSELSLAVGWRSAF